MNYPYVVLQTGSLKRLVDFANKTQVMPAGATSITKYLMETALDLQHRDQRLTFLMAELQGRTSEYFDHAQTRALQRVVGDVGLELFHSVDQCLGVTPSEAHLRACWPFHALSNYRFVGLAENGVVLERTQHAEPSPFA